ncbi:MAG: hypothetical protein QW087_05370 [Methanomassiliicoccales archaeon]
MRTCLSLYYPHEVRSVWNIKKVEGHTNYANPCSIAIDSSGFPYIAYSQIIEPYFEVGIVIRNSRTDDPFLNRNFKEFSAKSHYPFMSTTSYGRAMEIFTRSHAVTGENRSVVVLIIWVNYYETGISTIDTYVRAPQYTDRQS